MPRTYSLARLMLGITAFCFICGFAVNYPEESLGYALVVSLFFPTAIVCLMLISFSRCRRTVLVILILGAFVSSFLFSPDVRLFGPIPKTLWEHIWGYSFNYSGPPLDLWRAYHAIVIPASIPTAIGSLVFGGIALLVETHRCADQFPAP